MVEHAPVIGALRIQVAGIGEFKRAAEADHSRQVVRAAVLDNLSGLLIANKAGFFAADADVAMQRHVHAGPDRRAVYHGDGRLADIGDVAVQLGEAVKEVLADAIGAIARRTVANEILAGNFRRRRALEVRPRAEPAPNAGQHNRAYIRVIVARTHIFADLGHGTVFLRIANQRIHQFRPIEPDPQNSVILWLV